MAKKKSAKAGRRGPKPRKADSPRKARRANALCRAELVVHEETSGKRDRIRQAIRIHLDIVAGKGPKKRPGREKKSSKRNDDPLLFAPVTSRTLGALGHSVRIRILRKLLDGPATYQTLKKTTKLKPGPLYHHINQLRLSELILPKERDLYELSRGGRNLILGAIVLSAMIHDRRRRPMGGMRTGKVETDRHGVGANDAWRSKPRLNRPRNEIDL